MNCITYFILRALRRILKRHPVSLKYKGYLDFEGQEANDYLYSFLCEPTEKGKMVCKFGTVELSNIVTYHYEHYGYSLEYIKDVLRYNASLNSPKTFSVLCNNAGFFPNDYQLLGIYYKRMVKDMREIDVLSSYIYEEKYVASFMKNIEKRIDLDGFYAPFMWENPWTKFLKGKKVLVVHPFVESIKFQYEHNRERLFENKDVLPEFKELFTLKAVQSIADAKKQPYKDWFEALAYMENEISRIDFDVAIIGCGAYGMCLAAHVKRIGKIGIHLAGWTQMLFGVYGNRWLQDQPQYAKYINKYWTRPNASERPKGLNKVENGCYW